MTQYAYVNDDFVPESAAKVSIFDRGFLFADAVYEVSAVVNGRLIDNARHLARLESSLTKIGSCLPMPAQDIEDRQTRLIKRNGLSEGVIYIQASRGAAPRDFAYPADSRPSLIMFTQRKRIIDPDRIETGIGVKIVPEIRWGRRDIKTVALLAQSMAKQAALDSGEKDAWMVEDKQFTEGSSSNIFIVDTKGRLITRDLSNKILAGITRRAVIDLAGDMGIETIERPISVEEVYSASEVFSTSASTIIVPVCAVDGRSIGGSASGPITRSLYNRYLAKYMDCDM